MKKIILLLIPFVFFSCTSTMKMEMENYNPPEKSSISTKGNVLIINNIQSNANPSFTKRKKADWIFHSKTYGSTDIPKDNYLIKAKAEQDSIQAQYCIQNLVETLVQNSTFDSVSYMNYSGIMDSQIADSLCSLYRCSSLILLDELTIESDFEFERNLKTTKTWVVTRTVPVPRPGCRYCNDSHSRTYPASTHVPESNKFYQCCVITCDDEPRFMQVNSIYSINQYYSLSTIENEIECNWRIYDANSHQFIETIHTQETIKNFYKHTNATSYIKIPRHVSDSTALLNLFKTNYNQISSNINQDIEKKLAYSWEPAEREVYLKGNTDFEIAEMYLWYSNWESAKKCWEPYLENENPKIASRANYNMAVYYEVIGDLDLAIQHAEISANLYPNRKAKAYVEILKNRLPR